MHDQRVNGAFAQFLQLHVGGAAAQLHLDGRIPPHHVLQQVYRQHGGGGGTQAQPDRSAFHVGQDPGTAPQFGQLHPHAAGADQRQFAQRGQFLVLAPIQQGAAQFFLQRLNAAAQGGLGQMKFLRGAAEGLGFHQGQEMIQLLKIHAVSPRILILIMESKPIMHWTAIGAAPKIAARLSLSDFRLRVSRYGPDAFPPHCRQGLLQPSCACPAARPAGRHRRSHGLVRARIGAGKLPRQAHFGGGAGVRGRSGGCPGAGLGRLCVQGHRRHGGGREQAGRQWQHRRFLRRQAAGGRLFPAVRQHVEHVAQSVLVQVVGV
ncbi:hypothetical protein D3C85_1097040 [compost metagenome]